MGTTYELRQLKNSSDSSLEEAILLYASNIEPQLRTDSREIVYWLDNYPTNFKDKFIILTFYSGKKLIGYAQLAIFIEEKIIFVDYIVIHPNYRKNNTFYEFLEQIRDFLYNAGIEFDYVLAEIGSFDEDNKFSDQSKFIVRLLKLSGFKVVKTNYYHPKLGSRNFESEFRSVLMIYTGDDSNSIGRETYLHILNIIYFNHYLRWYKAFLKEQDFADYSIRIRQLYEKTKDIIKKKDRIELNGYDNPQFTPGVAVKFTKLRTIFKVLALILLFCIFMAIASVIHIVAKTKFGIETTAQYYIFLISIAATLFIFTMLAEGKTNRVATAIEKVLSKFR